MDRSGERARDDGVHDDEEVEVAPLVEEAGRLVGAVEQRCAGCAKALGDHGADGVVAPVPAPEADGGGSQSRSTSSRRKCVAQEMHGS